MLRKKREEVEAKYIAEFVTKLFPKPIKVFFQLPIGDSIYFYAKESGLNPRYYWRFGRRADAVVITQEQVVIIEAETRRPISGLSELEIYQKLAFDTPHLKPYMNRPIKCILVTPIFEEDVFERAKSLGIDYFVYRPKWIEKHLSRWGVLPSEEEGGE